MSSVCLVWSVCIWGLIRGVSTRELFALNILFSNLNLVFLSLDCIRSRRMSICVLQLVRRSKHIYGKRQVKNVSVQSLLSTDVLLELFLFTTSADCRLFRGNALVSEMQGLIFGDVFLTVFVSSHLSCGQLPLLQRFQRS
ncbi:unnamed protein product [Brassica oleracea]